MNNTNNRTGLDGAADRFTKGVGSTWSLVIHTIFFILAFGAVFVGYSLESVLLVLTTVVSLEAIYLAIFIQISVNRQSETIQEVEEDIDEIQEDVDEIQEDVGEIQDDVIGISADIDEMHEEDGEDSTPQSQAATIERIHEDLKRLVNDIEKLKTQSASKQ